MAIVRPLWKIKKKRLKKSPGSKNENDSLPAHLVWILSIIPEVRRFQSSKRPWFWTLPMDTISCNWLDMLSGMVIFYFVVPQQSPSSSSSSIVPRENQKSSTSPLKVCWLWYAHGKLFSGSMGLSMQCILNFYIFSATCRCLIRMMMDL